MGYNHTKSIGLRHGGLWPWAMDPTRMPSCPPPTRQVRTQKLVLFFSPPKLILATVNAEIWCTHYGSFTNARNLNARIMGLYLLRLRKKNSMISWLGNVEKYLEMINSHSNRLFRIHFLILFARFTRASSKPLYKEYQFCGNWFSLKNITPTLCFINRAVEWPNKHNVPSKERYLDSGNMVASSRGR